jgi:hypothetical protein
MFLLPSTSLSLLSILQLTPLHTFNCILCFPSHLLITAYVDSIDRVADSFKIKTFQWIEHGSFKDELTVIGLFKPMNRWLAPNSHMPNAKGLVFISGIIQHMQNTTVTLMVDTIAFLNHKA